MVLDTTSDHTRAAANLVARPGRGADCSIQECYALRCPLFVDTNTNTIFVLVPQIPTPPERQCRPPLARTFNDNMLNLGLTPVRSDVFVTVGHVTTGCVTVLILCRADVWPRVVGDFTSWVKQVSSMSEIAATYTIYDLLRNRAEKNSAAVAIASPQRPSLTYRQLLDQVDQTIESLTSSGISRGDRIALVLPGGPEPATAFLAVSSMATVIPLNPAYP